MTDFEILFPKNLYHSYIIESEPVELVHELISFLEKRGDLVKNSPDLFYQTYESFTIKDSRDIKEWHSRKGITNCKKICILSTKFINREAEQSLLKIIEEPAQNTHIFIIIPDASLLLDTILSRAHLVKLKNNDSNNKLVHEFLDSSLKDRFEIVTRIIKENKDEENSGKLRYYTTVFINEMESIYYNKFKEDKKNDKLVTILDELGKNRQYLNNPGASTKMILENIALLID